MWTKSVKIYDWSMTIWPRAVVFGLLLNLAAVGEAAPITYAFSRVVDSSAAIPGGIGNFTGFGVPSLDGGTEAFIGFGASGQIGIYAAAVGNSVTRVVDRNTSIPGGVGTFTGLSGISLDDGTIAFSGSGASQQDGIYAAFIGGSVILVADRNTPIPGGSNNFLNFTTPSLDGGVEGFGGGSESGIYAAALGGPVVRIADRNTPIPGGIGNFFFFGDIPSLDNGIMTFRGLGISDIHQGIYASDLTGSITSVVDVNTPIPGGSGNFLTFRGATSLDDGTVAFFGGDASFRPGIYTAVIGGAVMLVADTNTPIPGATGNFDSFGSFSLEDGAVAFNDGSPRPAIYADLGGMLTRVIGPNDFLDGRTVVSATLARESLSGDRIAFSAAFTDGTAGVYIAQAQQVPEPATLLLLSLGFIGLIGYSSHTNILFRR